MMVQSTPRVEEMSPRDERQISTLIFHLGREIRTALDRRLTNHGLTSQQAGLLLLSRILREANPIKMAERLGTDAAGMTRLIDRLVAKRLVMRRTNPDDRRSIVVVLGPQSKRVVPRLLPEFRQVEEGLLAGFDAREVKELNLLLRRLLRNARNLNR